MTSDCAENLCGPTRTLPEGDRLPSMTGNLEILSSLTTRPRSNPIMEIIAFVAISTILFAGLNVLGVPKVDLFLVLVLLFRALPQVRIGIDNYHRGFGSIALLDS